MYTLNIKDINVEPKITEDKIFEHSDDKYAVSSEAIRYINEKYPDEYNPYTLERLCEEAILHNGISAQREAEDILKKQNEDTDEEIRKEFEEETTQLNNKFDEITNKYKKLKQELEVKQEAETQGVDPYSEEYEEISKKYRVLWEELTWKEDKEIKAISNT